MKFGHSELQTPDPKKAEAFYAKVFGWKFTPAPGGMNYAFIDMGEGAAGGMMKTEPGMPTQWLNYVIAPDVAATAKEAEKAGAKVLTAKTEVPGYGWFVVLTDPTGAAFALWQPKQMK